MGGGAEVVRAVMKTGRHLRNGAMWLGIFVMVEGKRASNGLDGKGEFVTTYGEKIVALPKT